MSKTAISMKISLQALKPRNDLWKNEELFAKLLLALMVTIVDPIVRYLHESSTSMAPSKEEEEGMLDPDMTTAASDELMESTDMKRLGRDDADDNGLRQLRLGMSCETEGGLEDICAGGALDGVTMYIY
ncbi:hypothetical protein BU17DRAFT_70924 [Hysterangium stoloniferum]|nr:hypothetical protein BU17DRAFT_70924 [Hysterangium stoloniferum]